MLVKHDNVSFSEVFENFIRKVLSLIKDSTKEKIRAMDNVYRLFTDVKSYVSFDEATDKKLEYGAFAYCFADFRRDIDAFKHMECLKILERIKQSKNLQFRDLEEATDSFVQVLKAERNIYETCLLLAATSFTKNYVIDREVAYIEQIDMLEQHAANINALERAFEGYQEELTDLRQEAAFFYRQADAVLILLEWVLRNSTLVARYGSITDLVRELRAIDNVDRAYELEE